ncbi:cytochrome c [Massilia sp. YIM B02763]|uniref:cytochrome c n=1 Tax=Massilia sp. YIM B02763 TaxID=3050130 RepID=UPI0025B716D8|nr:cytochrome c [Massilia sp. YIM B02763]MDN4051728.1 cytochrome c [Massilia sp. YIM B02763]
MQLRTLFGGAAVAAIAAAALGGLYAWTRAAPIAPADAPPAPPPPAVLAAGARVVALGDCMVCHTAGDGPAYAGGLGLRTPFGTIYSTNITPDPETGIGRWTLDAFRRALREGTSRDGHLLYPAFPYIHYTRMSDNDIELAYRYLMTRTPVHAPAPANELMFPLSFRPVLAFWNMLYLRPGGSDIPARQATPIERGRYLVDTLGHCASCHSGLNLMGGERSPAFQGGRIDGWNAPALTRLTAGDAPWTQADLVEYLRGGLAPGHGAAKGPMRPVTERLAGVPREDVEAIAAYLISIQVAPQAKPAPAPATRPAAAVVAGEGPGAQLFAAACAGCHAAQAPMMRIADRPGLARSSAVLGSDPANFVQTVLQGIPWESGSNVYMPPFADTLDDQQIAQLAAYVRTGIAAKPAWNDVAATSAKARKENQQ